MRHQAPQKAQAKEGVQAGKIMPGKARLYSVRKIYI